MNIELARKLEDIRRSLGGLEYDGCGFDNMTHVCFQ